MQQQLWKTKLHNQELDHYNHHYHHYQLKTLSMTIKHLKLIIG
jgi:allantoicase